MSQQPPQNPQQWPPQQPPQYPQQPGYPQQPYYGQQPQQGYQPPPQGYYPPQQQPTGQQQYYQTDASGFMPAQDTKKRGRQQQPMPPQGYQPAPQGYQQQPYYGQAPARRQSPATIGCGLLILLVVLVAVVNQVSQRPTTPADQVGTIGQKVTVPNWDLVVNQPTTSKSLVWGEFGSSSNAVGTFVVVPVDLTNASKQAYLVNYFDFQIIDNQGRVYAANTDLVGLSYSKHAGGQDLTTEVPPGTTIKAYLVFDVSPQAQGLKLMFKQGNNPQVSLGI